MTAALALASYAGQAEWLEEAIYRADGDFAPAVANCLYDTNVSGVTDFLALCAAYRDDETVETSEHIARDVSDGLAVLEEVGLVVRVDDEITLTLVPMYDLPITIIEED
jgi:hypothetical protein